MFILLHLIWEMTGSVLVLTAGCLDHFLQISVKMLITRIFLRN